MATQQTVGATHPGHDRAVAEADDEVHAHGDLAADRLDHAHHLGVDLADGHAVDHLGDAVGGLELGLEHERVTPVAAANLVVVGRRRDAPIAVLVGPEQLGEARVGVEPGQAEPVDRAVSARPAPRYGCPR